MTTAAHKKFLTLETTANKLYAHKRENPDPPNTSITIDYITELNPENGQLTNTFPVSMGEGGNFKTMIYDYYTKSIIGTTTEKSVMIYDLNTHLFKGLNLSTSSSSY